MCFSVRSTITCLLLSLRAFICLDLLLPAFTCLLRPDFTWFHLPLCTVTWLYLHLPAFACLRLLASTCLHQSCAWQTAPRAPPSPPDLTQTRQLLQLQTGRARSSSSEPATPAPPAPGQLPPAPPDLNQTRQHPPLRQFGPRRTSMGQARAPLVLRFGLRVESNGLTNLSWPRIVDFTCLYQCLPVVTRLYLSSPVSACLYVLWRVSACLYHSLCGFTCCTYFSAFTCYVCLSVFASL